MTVPAREGTRSASWSFYDLEQKLAYKAAMNGSMVKKFDPAYTSQRCPKCGNINKTARDRDKHLYTCPVCHSVFNDDEAAARNPGTGDPVSERGRRSAL